MDNVTQCSQRHLSLTSVTVQLAGEETPVNWVNELTDHLFALISVTESKLDSLLLSVHG